MKKAIIVLTGLFVLSVGFIVALPSVRDEVHWHWVSYRNQPKYYAEYLKSWSDGRHFNEAKRFYDERSWDDAKASNTVQAFEKYLHNHPNGKHVQQTRERIENFCWLEANENNTVTSYQRYIDAYPTGRFITDAMSKKKTLLHDDTPYLAAQEQGSRQAYESFLLQFPGHKHEADARDVLKDMEGQDIVDLLIEKKLEVKAKGSGIENIRLEIRRLVNHEIVMRIPVGTFFVSHNSSVQNMVSTKEEAFFLISNEWVSASVSVACANRTLAIPRSEDSFYIRRSPYRKDLEKLMPFLHEANVHFFVQQAAIWIVTDNANYSDLLSLRNQGPVLDLYTKQPTGQVISGPAIDELKAVQAMKIVDEAGIDITQKAIWKDRQKIIEEFPYYVGGGREWGKEWIKDRELKSKSK